MNSQKIIPDVYKSTIKEHIKYIDYYQYYAWPMIFGSTSGPAGNGAGGQCMTEFTVEAYNYDDEGIAIYFCAGMYAVKAGRFEPLMRVKLEWKKVILDVREVTDESRF